MAMGRGTVSAAGVLADPAWAMRRELMSQAFTNHMGYLWIVR